MKRWVIPVLVLIGAFVTGGAVSLAVNRNDNQIGQIQDALIQVCEASKKPGGVRYIIAKRIESDLEQSKNLPYKDFFPDIPPATLKALLAQQAKVSYQEIHDLLGVNCADTYR